MHKDKLKVILIISLISYSVALTAFTFTVQRFFFFDTGNENDVIRHFTSEMPYEEPIKNEPDDDENIFLTYKKYQAMFESLSKWENKTILEKASLCYDILDLQVERLGIQEYKPTFYIASLQDGAAAIYDLDNIIVLDYECLQEEPLETVLKCICEEAFHSQETYILNKLPLDNECVMNSHYFSSIREWKANSEDYKAGSYTGREEYENQALERDAKAYASEETQRMLYYIKNLINV